MKVVWETEYGSESGSCLEEPTFFKNMLAQWIVLPPCRLLRQAEDRKHDTLKVQAQFRG